MDNPIHNDVFGSCCFSRIHLRDRRIFYKTSPKKEKMEIETYDQQMNRLEKWHKKELTSDQSDMFFRLLNEISDIAFSEIIDGWIKNSKPMPGHFPTVADLNELWRIWKADHSDLFEKKERPICEGCQNRGWLWFRGSDPVTKLESEFICGCAQCYGFKIDISNSRKIKISTRAKLESKGYQVWPYPYENKRKFKSLGEITKAVGGEIPF